MKRIKGTVPCAAFHSEDSDRWIGECKILGIVLEADSLDELHSLFSESISLLFVDLAESGDMDKFMKERGWYKEEKKSIAQTSFNWELIASGTSHDLQSAAA